MWTVELQSGCGQCVWVETEEVEGVGEVVRCDGRVVTSSWVEVVRDGPIPLCRGTGVDEYILGGGKGRAESGPKWDGWNEGWVHKEVEDLDNRWSQWV